ncbi:MAG: hypothetical protein RBU36_15585 [Thermoanaerobaculia bacterium]|jgi:hypothetical protein|nr:hypothetical protein [Thermoanaerobaculia bacterium]
MISSGPAWGDGRRGHFRSMRPIVRSVPAEAVLHGSLPGRIFRTLLAALLAASAVLLAG